MAASLFALQTDDRANSFVITRGEAFYMQVRYNTVRDRRYSFPFTFTAEDVLSFALENNSAPDLIKFTPWTGGGDMIILLLQYVRAAKVSSMRLRPLLNWFLLELIRRP